MTAAASIRSAIRSGRGLHGGGEATVTIRRQVDPKLPTTFHAVGNYPEGQRPGPVELSALHFVAEDRATAVVLPGGRRVHTVEHLFAAIVGLGAWSGLAVEVDGPEVPLLDGCATTFVTMIDEVLGPGAAARCSPRASSRWPTLDQGAQSQPASLITRAGGDAGGDAAWVIEREGTTLELRAGEGISVEVEVDYPAERFGKILRGRARWDGSSLAFRQEIAPARTFGAVRELAELRRRGLASYVPEGVVVALDAELVAWAPSDPAEPIRHKLLDVLGDLACVGGPPRGRLRIVRPSHRGVHAVLAALTNSERGNSN